MIKKFIRNGALNKLRDIAAEQEKINMQIANGYWPHGSFGYESALLHIQMLELKAAFWLALMGR